MMMKAKRLLLAAILCALAATSLAAQSAERTPIITIENGYDMGYNVATNAVGSAFRLGMGVALADNLMATFSFIANGIAFSNYQLLGLDYSIMPLLGVSVGLGQDTSTPVAVASVGVYSTVLGRSVAGGLQTGLRVRLDYIAPTTGFQNGTIKIGASALLGL
jgi:hypothetical protein